MHGMVNRAFQGFLTATYGVSVWAEVRGQAGLEVEDFEAMLDYPDAMLTGCVHAAAHVLHKPAHAVLEDFGTWLVTDHGLEPLRRLLRFSGAGFLDFVQSLEDMGDRGRLVLPDLELPQITLHRGGGSQFRVRARWSVPGGGPILMGALRAMADDYGTLAFLSLGAIEADGTETIDLQLLDTSFSEGRRFELAQVRA